MILSAAGSFRSLPFCFGLVESTSCFLFLGEVMRLLGIPDPQVWLAYTLSVLACLVCVGYGLVNWNKDE
jgi:hypothetical protein